MDEWIKQCKYARYQKATWNRIRVAAHPISWHKLIWFREEIPRCSFIAWLAILGRLPTRDRLSTWGLTVPLSCVLCSTGIEFHDHMFFQCPCATAVWTRLCASYITAPPVSILSCITLLDQAPLASSTAAQSVFKLLL